MRSAFDLGGFGSSAPPVETVVFTCDAAFARPAATLFK
jgi:hypothetical protein